jgi:dihydropteroate synthase
VLTAPAVQFAFDLVAINAADFSIMNPSPQSLQVGSSPRWIARGKTMEFGEMPVLMGIVNATPDSFSDGGQFFAPEAAVSHAHRLIDEGAGIIDVGGESTRPGAEPVDAAEEIRRVIPVVSRLSETAGVTISIDTMKSEVAREALAAGAHIVNDVSGLLFDPAMPSVCAEYAAGVVCMHIQGTPQTMQECPRYANAVEEIAEFLRHRLIDLEGHGIGREQIVLDPGIGFGKTAEHNLEILSQIDRFRRIGRPVLIGHSRKRFLKRLVGRSLDERLFATVGVAVALALQGTEIIRVHEVAAVRDAILACRTVLKWGSGA